MTDDRLLEKWVSAPGFPDYSVSNLGRVWSYKNPSGAGVLMRGSRTSRGYCVVCLRNEHVRKHIFVHRLVLEAFIGARPKGLQSAHLDGDQLNNRIENLRWVTPKENQHHRIAHGTMQYGEDHPQARLSFDEVRAICALRGILSTYRVAEMFNVSQSQVSGIQTGEEWANAR